MGWCSVGEGGVRCEVSIPNLFTTVSAKVMEGKKTHAPGRFTHSLFRAIET